MSGLTRSVTRTRASIAVRAVVNTNEKSRCPARPGSAAPAFRPAEHLPRRVGLLGVDPAAHRGLRRLVVGGQRAVHHPAGRAERSQERRRPVGVHGREPR